jgi:hypothetical protein
MRKKYYDSQVFNEENEISEAEAFERTYYVVCYFSGEKPEYAELLEKGKVYRVVYYDQQLPPSESILQKQHSRKDKTPFELALPPEYVGDKEIAKYYCFKAECEFDFILEYHSNAEGNLLLEIHRDENHIATSSTEYEYDDVGELLFIREYNADGKMVSELDYVDYYA